MLIQLYSSDDSHKPERRFALRPEETRAMPLHEASYRLVGVLLYSYNHHYIPDVLDADEAGRWIRYDANWNLTERHRLPCQGTYGTRRA